MFSDYQLFRHGVRAPESTVNGIQYDKEAFPYGLGELTEVRIYNHTNALLFLFFTGEQALFYLE